MNAEVPKREEVQNKHTMSAVQVLMLVEGSSGAFTEAHSIYWFHAECAEGCKASLLTDNSTRKGSLGVMFVTMPCDGSIMRSCTNRTYNRGVPYGLLRPNCQLLRGLRAVHRWLAVRQLRLRLLLCCRLASVL